MKKVLFVILAFLMLAVAAAKIYLSERVSQSFRDYEAMKRSGVFEAGWLPVYLPRSARDIRESHDIDTNHVEASFQYDDGDIEGIRSNCKLAGEASEIATYICGSFEIKLTKGGAGQLRRGHR